jgi:hypothetical protein
MEFCSHKVNLIGWRWNVKLIHVSAEVCCFASRWRGNVGVSEKCSVRSKMFVEREQTCTSHVPN